jgi:hypothetical protein
MDHRFDRHVRVIAVGFRASPSASVRPLNSAGRPIRMADGVEKAVQVTAVGRKWWCPRRSMNRNTDNTTEAGSEPASRITCGALKNFSGVVPELEPIYVTTRP